MEKMFDRLAFIKRRGQKSQELLENEAFKGAVAEVKKGYMDELINSPVKAQEDRERCYIAIRLMGEVERKLASYVSTAKYEAEKSK